MLAARSFDPRLMWDNAGTGMSDQPPQHDREPHPTAVMRSKIDRKRRLSLIWAIPVVTVIVGAWLAWTTLSERGPLITITFETAEGLQANQSHVRHKDVDMGVVQKVSLTPDLQRVQVTVRMNREAAAAADRQGAVLGGEAAVLRRLDQRPADPVLRLLHRSAAGRRRRRGRSATSPGWRIRRCCNPTCRAGPSC